jgi:hypothetical protein
MFSAGQTQVTPTTTPETTTPPETTRSTLNYINTLMCNSEALESDEHTRCVNALTDSYTTNKNLVPEALKKMFDATVELITNLIFTDCSFEEMRSRQSASARARMCIPVGDNECEGERPVTPVAQCTYEAVMGERVALLETSEPVTFLGAIFSYLGSFAETARMLGGSTLPCCSEFDATSVQMGLVVCKPGC